MPHHAPSPGMGARPTSALGAWVHLQRHSPSPVTADPALVCPSFPLASTAEQMSIKACQASRNTPFQPHAIQAFGSAGKAPDPRTSLEHQQSHTQPSFLFLSKEINAPRNFCPPSSRGWNRASRACCLEQVFSRTGSCYTVSARHAIILLACVAVSCCCRTALPGSPQGKRSQHSW